MEFTESKLTGPFLDELDACQPETDFWKSVVHNNSPTHLHAMPHREDGTTTVVYQGSVPVGISVKFRDEHNHTFLATMDLRTKE